MVILMADNFILTEANTIRVDNSDNSCVVPSDRPAPELGDQGFTEEKCVVTDHLVEYYSQTDITVV